MFPPFFLFLFEGSGDPGSINVVFPNYLDHLTFDMSLFVIHLLHGQHYILFKCN